MTVFSVRSLRSPVSTATDRSVPLRNEACATELTQIVGEEAQAAMLGQKSADDAIKTMQGRLTESMASAKKAN